MKYIALISAMLKYIHNMYTYKHKQNTNKQIETHSSVSTQKKKKNQIDYTKLSYRVLNPKTYLSVCINSVTDTKRNTTKTTKN